MASVDKFLLQRADIAREKNISWKEKKIANYETAMLSSQWSLNEGSLTSNDEIVTNL